MKIRLGRSLLLVALCLTACAGKTPVATFSVASSDPNAGDALTPSADDFTTPAPDATETPLVTTSADAGASVTASADPGASGGVLPTPVVQPSRGPTVARGFVNTAPWLVYYGTPDGLGDLDAAASTYRIFVIQADAYTPAQISKLHANGRNRVLAYLDVGSVEHTASWWTAAPAGFVAAGKNTAAQLGAYGGYPDETWMNPANADWQHLLVDYIAAGRMATGVDGFFIDNMELVEHGAAATDGPCNTTCASAGLELIYQLRQKFPDAPFVMNGATGDDVRTATVHGEPFPSLLDGVVHEDVFTQPSSTTNASDATYQVKTDDTAVSQLVAWKNLNLQPGGHPFWVGTLDFVNACSNTSDAQSVAAKARTYGFSPSVSDKSAGLQVICKAP